jgi:hypothetical protein
MLTPVLYLVSYLLILGAFSAFGFRPLGAPHPLTVLSLAIEQSAACIFLTLALAVAASFARGNLVIYTTAGVLVGVWLLGVISYLPGYSEGFWLARLHHGLIGLGTGYAVLRVLPRLGR